MAFYVAVVCSLTVLLRQVHPKPTFTFPITLDPSSFSPALQVDSTGRVFVSAENMLFRLSPDLVQEESIVLSAEVVDRGVALSGDGSKVVVCLTDLPCSVYNATDLSAGPTFTNNIDSIISEEAIALFTGGDTFYIGGGTYEQTIQLGQYGFGPSVFARTAEYTITESMFGREFVGGCTRGGYAYYFVIDRSKFRVMRLCHATDCPNGHSCSIQALYETSILCGLNSTSFPFITDVSVVDNFAGNPGPTVVITRLDIFTYISYMCFVDLNDIDSRMDAKYDSCSMRTTTEDVTVAWIMENKSCDNFTVTGRCDFSDPLDDISAPDIVPTNTISLDDEYGLGAATEPVVVDSISLLFVARRKTVYGFDVGKTPYGAVNLRDAFTQFSVDNRILELAWQPGLGCLTCVTISEVVQLPIEECSSHADCASCIADRNPLCGWCVVENQCSRQSQCQTSTVNGTSTLRWIQDSTQCLIYVTVTPNEYSLDTPELLSVSVTPPGLPVLLPNETYYCYFANNDGRFNITVHAVEVSPRTDFTCDIRGMVPAYQGVTVVVDLSFVSSLFGVPFITANDSFTIFSNSQVEVIVPAVIGSFLLLVIILIIIIVTVVCVQRRRQHPIQLNFQMTEHTECIYEVSGVSGIALFQSEFDNLMKEMPDSLKIPSSQLTLSTTSIGQGEFGVVYKAQLNNWIGKESQMVAVKTPKGLFSLSDLQNMMSEIIKMQEFHHTHVMSLIGVCMDAGAGVSVVMPYMANGSLLDYLKKERGSLELDIDSEIDQILVARKLLLRLCHQISLGMRYLALKKFIHRDLAARNCMLDRSGNIKVGDFGLAEDVYSTGYFKQQDRENVKLPFKWMAPESLNDVIFTEKTDVWSYGVTVWEIFSGGRTPYPAMDPMSLIKLLREGRRLERPDNAACATEIFSVMRKCWREVPDDRPDFAELACIADRLMSSIADYTELSMNLAEGKIGEEPGYSYVPIEPQTTVHHISYDAANIEDNVAYCTSDGVNVKDNVAYVTSDGKDNVPYSTSDGVNVEDNVAYSTSDGVNVEDNVAYGTSSGVNDEDNVAYVTSNGLNDEDNVAYGTNDDVNVKDNVAYVTNNGVNDEDNVAYGTNDDVNVKDNVAYVTSDGVNEDV